MLMRKGEEHAKTTVILSKEEPAGAGGDQGISPGLMKFLSPADFVNYNNPITRERRRLVTLPWDDMVCNGRREGMELLAPSKF